MNKKYTYIWVSLIILIFGIIVIPRIIDRVKTGSIVENDRMNVTKPSDRLAYVLFDGEKRRVPNFKMLNQDSVMVSDGNLRGKVYVVDFFFTRCPSICPIMTQNLVRLQNKFQGYDNFATASFSITPDYDTPAVLRRYAQKYGATNPNWHFFTGDKSQVYELANRGFNIFAAENAKAPGGFEHSGLFALVDKEGYLRSRVDEFGNPIVYYRGMITEKDGENAQGEKEQISMLREDIQKLLKE